MPVGPPVQEIEIHVVGAQTLERALAGFERAPAGGIRGQDLGGDEDAIALSSDRVGHDLLGSAVGVHLRRVEVGQAQVDAELERGDLVLADPSVLAHVPGALADDADGDTGQSERAGEHPPSVHRAARPWR
jgi:hypothetical protein